MKLGLPKMVTGMLLISLLASGNALAQRKEMTRDWQDKPPSAEQQLHRLSTALDLDDQQSLELLVILQEQAENRAALHAQVMEMIGPEVCAQRAAFEEDILAILNEEQTVEFLRILEDRQSKHRGGRFRGLDCDD